MKLLISNGRSWPIVAYSPDARRVAAAYRGDDHTTIWSVPETAKQP